MGEFRRCLRQPAKAAGARFYSNWKTFFGKLSNNVSQKIEPGFSEKVPLLKMYFKSKEKLVETILSRLGPEITHPNESTNTKINNLKRTILGFLLKRKQNTKRKTQSQHNEVKPLTSMNNTMQMKTKARTAKMKKGADKKSKRNDSSLDK